MGPWIALLLVVPALGGAKKVEQANLDLIRGFYERVFVGEDLTAVDEVVTDPEERESRRELYRNAVENYDGEMMLDRTTADGNLVFVEWTYKGRHLALDKPVRIVGVDVYELEDGRVVRSSVTFDRDPLFRQLGVDPYDPHTQRNEAATRVLIEMYNSGDLSRFEEVIAPDCVIQFNQREPRPFTRESMEEELAEFATFDLEIDRVVAQGDLVSFIWDLRATAHDGRELEVSGAYTARFEDGRMVESWERVDTMPGRAFREAAARE